MSANDFEFLFTVHADGNIPVSKYKSRKTGLTVFIAQVEGPLVNGFLCLATEAHDDDGLPHTLEHLVFMGSEEYPYKGVLDLLANRCLASGTNAWTDTDHTCYTMTNAGSEGFLKLLPIYMDHVLYPTLKESAYITEVHHVNGEGEDAGVVYCEMQARENSGESRSHLAMARAMYPGHCGYKSETGGIMENLRTSTSQTKVCNYHRDFYRPENLCVVITGQVKPEDVFTALQPVEDKIVKNVKKGARAPFKRPWQSKVPPLDGTVEQVLKYPSDEETHGMVYAAWRGPQAKDQYSLTSMSVLLEYLTESAISPLQRDFVEIDDPYCSKVDHSVVENSVCYVYFKFANVPKTKLDQIHNKLNSVLVKLAGGKEQIDMKRMNSVIHRKILEALHNVEDQPHDTVAFILIGDFLYSDTKEDLEMRTNNISMYKKMKTEAEEFWVKMIQKYFIDKSHVVLVGEPSCKLMEELGQADKDRVAKQREMLGEDGLKQKEETLEKATEENEIEPPESVLTSVSVPDVASIYFHTICPSSNLNQNTANKNNKFPLSEIPFRFQLDDIHTNFVQINALLDSSALSRELKYYLPLFCEVLFESSILREGALVPHEEVIAQLQADTLTTQACLGITGSKFTCGAYPQIVHIMLKVEEEKYSCGVNWLKELMYCTQFTGERLKVVAQRMANDISTYKRKGNQVVRTLLRDLLFAKDCNHYVSSILRQEKFLTDLVKQLEADPDRVTVKMEELRNILTRADNLRVHMSANVKKLAAESSTPQTLWQQFIPENIPHNSDRCVMKKTYEYVVSSDSCLEKRVIVGVGSVESAYLIQAVGTINDFNHPDLPAVNVFLQYMTLCEGPLWKQIRGLGLSYHYAMFVKPETGLLYFILARSTHIVNAYKEARDILLGYVNGKTEFSAVELEAAKSSLIFEIIEEEKTVSDVSHDSMLSYMRGVDHSYNKEMLQKVAKVTIADLQRVGSQYITPLFDVNNFRCAVCCHPSKVEEVTEGFKELSVAMKVIPSLEDDVLCSY